MHAAAKRRFPADKYDMERTAILSAALGICQENDEVTSRRKLRRLIIPQVKQQMRASGYRGIMWTAVLWWLIPKLVEWLIIEWINGRFD